MKEVVGKWARMLQTELEGGRAIHNSSGEFKDIKKSFVLWLPLGWFGKIPE